MSVVCLLFAIPTHAHAPTFELKPVETGKGTFVLPRDLETVVRWVINCESGGDPKAVGDHGTSFGLVQINLPSHPEISREQAEDPVFALKYLQTELKAGRGNQWTCYRLYKQQGSL